MAVMYFYCDESGKYRAQPVITVTGVGVTKDRQDRFDTEWRAILRAYKLEELHMSRVADLKQNVCHHMPANQTINERIDALLPFADCMNQYLEYGLVEAWDVKGYAHLTMEVKRVLGGANDPYFMAFVRGALEIVHHVLDDDRVVIVCDDDLTAAWDTYLHYRAVRDAYPSFKRKTIGISFANSSHFPALQAADLVAFLSRLEAKSQFYKTVNDWKRLYEYATTPPKEKAGIMQWSHMFADEQKLREFAQSMRDMQHEGRFDGEKPK